MLRVLFFIFGMLSFSNGLWMLISAETWYPYLPAAVTDTGPYNGHFIRDIALVFMLSGIGFFWSCCNLDKCWPIHIGQTIFVAGHAFLHVIDIIFGRLPHSHWWIDAPLLFIPAIIMVFLCVPKIWHQLNPESNAAKKEKMPFSKLEKRLIIGVSALFLLGVGIYVYLLNFQYAFAPQKLANWHKSLASAVAEATKRKVPIMVSIGAPI